MDFLGFLWSNLDFSKGYSEKIKKIRRPLNSPQRLCANAGPGRILTASRPSDSSTVNLLMQNDIAYVSVFVNELDCGLKVGDQLRMSREACVGSRLDP